MKKVTLGGERLGAGKKMKVEVQQYARSNFDRSYVWRSTMAPGVLVPFMSEVILPGSTFDIKLHTNVKTYPTVGPLFGSFKLQEDLFMVPVRLYNSWLHNNRLGIGLNMSNVKLPNVRMICNNIKENQEQDINFDLDNLQINPSALVRYLGISGVGINSDRANNTFVERRFNAVPILAYYDIFKCYYSNKQEERGYVITANLSSYMNTESCVFNHSDNTIFTFQPSQDVSTSGLILLTNTRLYIYGTNLDPERIEVSIVGRGNYKANQIFLTTAVNPTETSIIFSEPKILDFGNETIGMVTQKNIVPANQPIELRGFDLRNIDEMRDVLLSTSGNVSYEINNFTQYPYRTITDVVNLDVTGITSMSKFPMVGLCVKTYQSDIYNNWLREAWISGVEGINELTKIDTSDGLKIEALIWAKKVYEMLNDIAVSDGTYESWIDAVYDTESWNRAETPVYLGGASEEIVFQEVVSNNASEIDGEKEPLGTLGGRGVSVNSKGGTIKCRATEPCYIMGIVSLTPRVDYYQGNKWDMNLKTMDDFHKPGLDQIGFQDLITDQMAWWDTKIDNENRVTYYSAGKQPAWINYMTNTNKCFGHFIQKDMSSFMVLTRKYEKTFEDRIKDITTYIDPTKWNTPFAVQDLTAQNFWVQIGVTINARQKMSAKIMPRL